MPSMSSSSSLRSCIKIVLLLVAKVAQAQQDFVSTGPSCVDGYSGTGCPKIWHITKGPGWEGQRATWANGRGVRIMCSPSCTDSANPKVCSLIMAFHGIYSNPGDQEWLMMGSSTAGKGIAFSESPSDGGPYCISFHKSAGHGWQYTCNGSDHVHLNAFIDYALQNFPIDPEAVNVHGFSSGGIQIHNMMQSHCEIESKIAAACSYGSGNIPAPPTTKAAYLLVHGTHDGVVIYRNLWDSGVGKAVLSCCDYDWDGKCENPGYYHLYAEGLGAAIATLRGYQGDIIGGTHPKPSYTLGLVDDTHEKCNGRITKCTSPIEDPNPWNEGFSCPIVDGAETDVLDYPVNSASGAGPVQVWRINTWNHDYPNRRRSSWGPTEFFMQLRKFFYDNRGRKTYRGTRTVKVVSSRKLCASPYWSANPLPFTNDGWDATMTSERCRNMCLNDYQCADAFYIDVTNYSPGAKACQIWLKNAPCKNPNHVADWAVAAIHFRGSTSYSSTAAPVPLAPTPKPTPTPTKNSSASPSGVPTTPTTEMCPIMAPLIPNNNAGYACVVNGESIGDSNNEYTEEQCKNENGTWTPYDCGTANLYWLQTNDPAMRKMLSEWWVPKCCKGADQMCVPPKDLKGGNLAGYSCVKPDGTSPGDSNNGNTEEECRNDMGGTWTPYNCDTAVKFWLTQNVEMRRFFSGWWVPKCCFELTPSTSPTKSPVTLAPTKSLTTSPSNKPTKSISNAPTKSPSSASPTESPVTLAPTTSPSTSPSTRPSDKPTKSMSNAPTKSPTLANNCDGLNKAKCIKKKKFCTYNGKKKIFLGDCVPKTKLGRNCGKAANDSKKTCMGGENQGHCVWVSGECKSLCSQLTEKKACNKKKSKNKKICKWPKISNPCFGCQPKSICG